MADIRPFLPLRYDRSVVGDMHNVISPPYDVITEKDRVALQAKSEFNAVGLDLTNPSYLSETGADQRHQKSRETLNAWIAGNVLVQEQKPCLYVVQDSFEWKGQKHDRIGILCTVKMEKPGKTILPHEKVLDTPIEDRMKLLKAVQAHLSPVFFVCHDEEKNILSAIRNLCSQSAPESFEGSQEGLSHRIWKVENPKDTEQLQRLFEGKNLLIADGHHRYQTSYLYSLSEEAKSMEEAKWMLSYISLFPSDGLVVSAFHRLVTSDLPTKELLAKLAPLFDIVDEKLDWQTFERSTSPLALVNGAPGRMYLLIPKKDFPLLAPELTKIPTSLLNSVLLEIFRIDITQASDQKKVSYFPDEQKLLDAQKESSGIGFWVKSVFVPDIFDATKVGYVLPPKSTYFYPKVPTGIAFHLLKS